MEINLPRLLAVLQQFTMDPISISSLILDISRIISSVIDYATTVKHARSETRKLSEELFARKGILEHLSAQQPTIPASENPGSFNLASALHSTIEFLHSLLADLEGSGHEIQAPAAGAEMAVYAPGIRLASRPPRVREDLFGFGPHVGQRIAWEGVA